MQSSTMFRIGLLVFMLTSGQVALARSSLQVQVREGELRNRPSFLGAVVSTVQYGDQVEVRESQGVWRRVQVAETTGWIHESALTSRRIEWQAGERELSGAATQDELALAGRGFNAQVEGQFRADNQQIDFRWVDAMEAMRKTPFQLRQFLVDGGLRVEE